MGDDFDRRYVGSWAQLVFSGLHTEAKAKTIYLIKLSFPLKLSFGRSFHKEIMQIHKTVRKSQKLFSQRDHVDPQSHDEIRIRSEIDGQEASRMRSDG